MLPRPLVHRSFHTKPSSFPLANGVCAKRIQQNQTNPTLPPPQLTTLPSIHPLSNRIREHPIPHQIAQIPPRRALRLPRPKQPPSITLIRIQLRLDELPRLHLQLLTPRRHTPGLKSGARPDGRTARERPVEPRTLGEPVEILCAIGHRAGPLARYDGVRGSAHFAAKGTGCAYVSGGGEGDLVLGEDFVVVRVLEEVSRGVPRVPGRGLLEGVVEGGGDVCFCEGGGAGGVEAFYAVDVEAGAEGFVEELDGGYCWVVGVVVADLVEDVEGVLDCVSLLPFDGSESS